MPTLTLLPALVAIIYAVITKYRRGQTFDVILLTLGGSCALYNGFFMYGFFTEEYVSGYFRCVQQVISCLIVPTAYMYFAAQMGYKQFNGVSVTLWSLVILLLMPSGFFSLDGSLPDTSACQLQPMMLYFHADSKEVFTMHTADAIILIQGLLTFTRLVVMTHTLHRYKLAFSPRLRYFLGWWAAAIVFIIFTSFHNTKEFSEPVLLWTYYVSYSILIISIFVLLALNFNLRPIMLSIEDINDDENDDDDVNDDDDDNDDDDVNEYENEKESANRNEVEDGPGTHIDDIDTFILHSRMMADRVRQMMDEHILLNPKITVADVIAELRTNRTYFCRMMHAEFGCTFTELLTEHRMKHAQHLLSETNMSIAEIAQHSGFTDSSNFSRRFRQIYGISPKDYRGN